MKKFFSLLLALSMALSLTACGGSTDTADTATDDTADAAATETTAEPVEVVVFAAASMEATLTEIADLYKEVAPECGRSSSPLTPPAPCRTQILEGADLRPVHLRRPGPDERRWTPLTPPAPTPTATGSGLLRHPGGLCWRTRWCWRCPTTTPPASSPLPGLLATGQAVPAVPWATSDVPVGSVLPGDPGHPGHRHRPAGGRRQGDLWLQRHGGGHPGEGGRRGLPASSTPPTPSPTSLTVVDEATADMCGQVIYPAAVMKSTSGEAAQAAAQAFLDYLRTDDAAVAVLEGVGFTVL